MDISGGICQYNEIRRGSGGNRIPTEASAAAETKETNSHKRGNQLVGAGSTEEEANGQPGETRKHFCSAGGGIAKCGRREKTDFSIFAQLAKGPLTPTGQFKNIQVFQ